MALAWLLLVLALAALVYRYLTHTYNHWAKQNIPSLPSPLPGFGHLLPLLTLRESLASFGLRLYRNDSGSLLGFYFLRRPAVLVREPELVRRVLQADFPSFSGNFVRLNELRDPVLSKHPFFVEDPQAWKTLRARVAGHLTGKKLRSLFRIVDEVADKLSSYVDRKITRTGQFECELKELCMRYTGEIVANSAFAIEGQSFDDYPDELAFTNVAKSVFASSPLNSLKQALLFYAPDLANLLGLSMLSKSTDDYFRRTVRTILERRKSTGERPDDFLQFCVDACDDEDSVIADVITFYVDVYETSSLTLADVLYYIAENPEVQERLREDEDGYLDQVIQESMRLLVPVGMHIRRCTAPVCLEGSDGLKCWLRPGDYVCVSATGLHLDERFWSEPQLFDPGRFDLDQQKERNRYVFLPFGEGPRQCVGSRLGLMIVKHAVVTLLKSFRLTRSERTKKPLEFETFAGDLLSRVKGGLWAKFEKL